MEDWPQIAARQFGLIHRNQALATGLSSDAIYRRVSADKWREVLPGVYALRGAPRSWRQELRAGTLWAGELSAASFRSAAALFGFPGFAEGIVEITSPRNLRSHRPDLVIHRLSLPRRDIAKITRIPVTTPVRTICDLAAVTEFEPLQEVVDFAYGRRLISYDRLARVLEPAKGRHGIAKLREIVADASPPPESVLERRFLRRVEAAGFSKPVRQYRVWDGGSLFARVDFAFPDLKIAIEADGFAFHSGRRVFDSDRAKWNRLTTKGWRILYVTWTDLQRACPNVLAGIEALVGSQSKLVYPGPR